MNAYSVLSHMAENTDCMSTVIAVAFRCIGGCGGKIKMEDLFSQRKRDKWLEFGALIVLSVIILYVHIFVSLSTPILEVFICLVYIFPLVTITKPVILLCIY